MQPSKSVHTLHFCASTNAASYFAASFTQSPPPEVLELATFPPLWLELPFVLELPPSPSPGTTTTVPPQSGSGVRSAKTQKIRAFRVCMRIAPRTDG